MRWGEVGWVMFLAGLPFSHLLNRSLDIWHGQAVWAQGWCVSLWALSLGTTTHLPRPNKGLAWFLAWIGLSSLFLWMKVIVEHKTYPLPMLQALMHLVLVVLAYQAAMTTWKRAWLPTLLRGMAWAGVLVVAYCGLQLLNLDQFFTNLDRAQPHDPLVGTIGNPSHLAVQLAMLLSLFLLQPGWFWKGMAGVTVLLLGLTHSISGQVAGGLVLAWWAYHWKPWTLWVSLGMGMLGGVWLWLHPSILNLHGRWEAWTQFYTLFAHRPITGLGAGFVMELSRTVTEGPIFQWRHVHNEVFQAAMEYGLIGVACLGWMVKDLLRSLKYLSKTPLVVALSGVLIAFGITSLVNFPAHLWVLGSYAFVAYCGLRVLETETV